MFNTSKPYKIYPLDLVSIHEEAKDTYTYYFKKPKELSWEEGAHTHLALNRFDEGLGWFQKKDVRHFSIFSLVDEEYLAISTRIPNPMSEFKEAMSKAKSGDRFYVFKVGSRLKLRRQERPVVLLSAGVAMATIRPLVKSYDKNSQGITKMIHINIDSSGEYLYQEEFEQFQKSNPNFTNRHVNKRKDFYQELSNLLRDDEFADYYVIGSYDFIVEVYGKLKQAKISDEQIFVDTKEGVASLKNTLIHA
ncbi:MAG: FAD-dependent oxidoreductase [Vallitaleaceae bacterium]|nr:FAD-dependent oxidoreductase [Vallitaleaceae bacterium]